MRGYSIDDQELRLSIRKALQQLPIMMSTAQKLRAQFQRQSSADRDGGVMDDSDSIEGLKHCSNERRGKTASLIVGEEQK
jgi:hypothetical protein